jgi:hypothetical protein
MARYESRLSSLLQRFFQPVLAWAGAGIDFVFRQKAKKTAGLYFISLEKSKR